jgi:hypothetical protein
MMLRQLHVTSNDRDNVIVTVHYTIARKKALVSPLNKSFDIRLERARKPAIKFKTLHCPDTI